MSPDLPPTLAKLALPCFAIAAVLAITRWRGLSWTDDIGLVWPRPAITATWVAIWIGWVVLGEFAVRTFGLAQAAPWKPYPLLIIVLRIVAIGLLGPAAEEIVVRGVLFYRIGLTRLGPIGAIVIGAALWAVAHVQYDGMTMLLIFLDGLVLGTARLKSRSTFVPIVMHALGNLASIYQSLAGGP